MIAVVIPSVHRAEKLPGLVENIHDTTGSKHRVYLILERHDEESIAAARKVNAVRLIRDSGSFAKAANDGYQSTREPFVAFANDDVRFWPGWDEKALARMSDQVHIVGLNDGSGDCKCFQLVRRAYIEQHSGVFDRPNAVYHEYASQCPDTELAHYAMLRGVWADAPDAVCLHEHWRFGLADRAHPNYLKAASTNGVDLETYNARREQWDPDHRTPDCVPTT